ncbi:MAG: CDP-alcohol phosphatidyltransferase family protein [Bacteroidia bacterium]
MKLFTVPNLFTLANLLCGCLAVVFIFEGNPVISAYLVGVAAVLDFLDGFMARLLNQHSPIGKELDSLADCVTFGVVPGILMFKMISWMITLNNQVESEMIATYLPYVAFIIPLFSALRLAKFNIDTRQSESFIGVPTPANSILLCSFPVIMYFNKSIAAPDGTLIEPLPDFLFNPWFYAGLSLVMSVLLISEIPLFALKFKSFGWKKNEIRYIFLGMSLILLIVLREIALPLIIALYILLSVVNNLLNRSAENKA